MNDNIENKNNIEDNALCQGVIHGKEIIIHQYNLERCFFCEKFTLPVDFMYQKTIEQLNRFKDIIGDIPHDGAGKIGNKIICNDCQNDLYNLLELDKYAIDYDYD